MKTVKSFYSKNKILVILISILGISVVAASILAAEGLRFIINGVSNRDLGVINHGIICAIIGFTLWFGINAIQNHSIMRLTFKFHEMFERKTLESLLSREKSGLDAFSKGDLQERMTKSISDVSTIYIKDIAFGITHLLTVIGVLVYLLYLSVLLTVFSLSFMFIMMGISQKLSSFGPALNKHVQEKESAIHEIVQQSLQAKKTIRTESLYDYRRKSFKDQSGEFLLSSKKLRSYNSMFEHVNKTVFFLLTIAIFLIGGYLRNKGQLDIGAIASFMLGLSRLQFPIMCLAQTAMNLQKSKAAYKRIEEISNLPEKKSGGSVFPENMESLVLRDLAFRYNEGKEVLKKINMEFKPGKVYAIVGESGAGKSTLVNILRGMYTPTAGEITVNQVKIEDYASYQKEVTYIAQEPFIFTDTIMNNILYAEPKASNEEVINAAKKAMIHEFIMELPDGYNTLLEDNGKLLSGGQRQRIALARGFIRRSKIMLFDEPTAALDSSNEEKIRKSIYDRDSSIIKVVISHKSSMIKDADEIILIADGVIMDEGVGINGL